MSRRSALVDGFLMAVGTLTAQPVPAPSVIDRAVAGRAMSLAPLIGLELGVIPLVAHLLVRHHWLPPWVVAVLVVIAIELVTRGFHIDGLADTVDGFSASYDRERALTIMRTGDVGPMGAGGVVLTLGLQVAALASLLTSTTGAALAVCALVVSRLSLSWGCTPLVPSARPHGLGATVSGAVPIWLASATSVGLLAAGIPLLWWAGANWYAAPVIIAGGLAMAAVLFQRATARLGGITGDVLGAGVQLTHAAALVAALIALH